MAKATIAEWSKKVSDQAVQRLPLLGLMRKHGRIEFGCSGGECRWPFQFRYHDLDGHADGQNLTFERRRVIDNANLPWRGYDVTDAVTILEKRQNSGKAAVVQIFNDRKGLMTRGALQKLAREFYNDGNLAANVLRFHGLESFMSLTGQTATDELATTLNDSYAGHSTSYTSFNSQAVKGTDEEYGAWSPVIVNTNRTVNAATRAFADYADDYLRSGILEAQYGDADQDMPNLILLTKAAYKSLLSILDDKERLTFMRGSDLGLSKFGFKKFVEFDGVPVTYDVAIPATDANSDTVHGYGFNLSRMKLKILGGKKSKSLFEGHLDYDPYQKADLISLLLLGNLVFESPRHFIKFADIS